MELHFCSVCGVSIPNVEVESGLAMGEGGKNLCSEHRDGAADAKPAETAPATDDGTELELLFCANCRVSVPASDQRSGRARKEYGSLLCAVCTKADPGKRAARREAVEAEMAADIEAEDPVKPTRCNVCSAVVPHSHVVTGKALVQGDRVVCESCRAVSSSKSGGGGLRVLAVFLIVAALAGGIGYVIGPMVQKRMAGGPTPSDEVAALRAEMDGRIAKIAKQRDDDRAAITGELKKFAEAVGGDVADEIGKLRTDLAGVRADLARDDVRLDQRVARMEGELKGLQQRIDDVVSRANATVTRPEVVVKKTDTTPERTRVDDQPRDDQPVVPEVNEEVVRLSKDLLESGEDGVRFPAANELGRIGDPAATPALAWALVNDKHFLVRRACARSLSMLKSWFATPYLIEALEDKEAYVAQQANFALRNITQQDFEVTQDQSLAERRRRARTAKKWWDKNKDTPPEGVSMTPAELQRN